MTYLEVREFEGHQIRQRDDGYFNLTDMAKATGKDFYDWIRLDSTEDFLSVISHNTGISRDILITSKQYHGTYGHKKVAIAFATWCSPEFFSKVIDWADDVMTKGGHISENATSEQLEALKEEISEKESRITKLLSENKSLVEANQDGSMVHLKLVFLFRRALQDLRELRMWSFETKREKQIYEALKGMSEMMDSLFGSNDMSLKDWDELKSDLNNKQLDKYAQTLLHTSFEEYIGNWADDVKLTNKIVGRK
jgi:hypothetical protein